MDLVSRRSLSPGGFLPSERQLQVEIGTSRTTLRRALQHLAEQDRLVSVPNRGMALPSAGPATGLVAMIDGSSAIQVRLYTELNRLLAEEGLHLVHLDGSPGALERSLHQAAQMGCVGALVWPDEGFPNEAEVSRVAEHLPLVCLGLELRGFRGRLDLVEEDNLEAGLLATRHLFDQGCRNIAIAGMLDMLGWTHDRFSGYLKAHFEAGVQPQPENFIFLATSGHNMPDLNVFSRRLEHGRPLDGLVVMQDEYAQPLVELMLAQGLHPMCQVRTASIGTDRIVRLDGVPIPATVSSRSELARLAVETLRSRLADPSRRPRTARVSVHLSEAPQERGRSISIFTRVPVASTSGQEQLIEENQP